MFYLSTGGSFGERIFKRPNLSVIRVTVYFMNSSFKSACQGIHLFLKSQNIDLPIQAVYDYFTWEVSPIKFVTIRTVNFFSEQVDPLTSGFKRLELIIYF